MERESFFGRKCFVKFIFLIIVFEVNVSIVGFFFYGFELFWCLKINIVKRFNVKNRD